MRRPLALQPLVPGATALLAVVEGPDGRAIKGAALLQCARATGPGRPLVQNLPTASSVQKLFPWTLDGFS